MITLQHTPDSAQHTQPEPRLPHVRGAAGGPRILLVDDHEVVRVGLRALLSTVPGFAVVGEADSVASAIEAARRLHPDVVAMDVRLLDGSGVETVWHGGSLLDPTVTHQVLERVRRLGQHEADEELGRLSEQERKILPLIA